MSQSNTSLYEENLPFLGTPFRDDLFICEDFEEDPYPDAEMDEIYYSHLEIDFLRV